MKKQLLLSVLIGTTLIPSTYAFDWNHSHKNGYQPGDKITSEIFNINTSSLGSEWNAPAENNRLGTFEYAIPKWVCMEKSGLPTIFDAKTKTPLTITGDLNNVFLSEEGSITITSEIMEEYIKFLTDIMNNSINQRNIKHPIFGTHHILYTYQNKRYIWSDILGVVMSDNKSGNEAKEILEWWNFLKLSDNTFVHKGKNSPIFEYSTDNGASWESYSTREDAHLPEWCVITNFRIHDIIDEKVQQAYDESNPKYYTIKLDDATLRGSVLGYQWEVTVKDNNKGYIVDSIQFTNQEGITITKERSLVQNIDVLTKHSMNQQCETSDLHVNITEPVKPVDPQPTPKEDSKKDEPKTPTPTTSGPGGAVSVVTTTPKVDNPPVVETPKTPATIIPSLPVAPAVKEEKPAFTMEFTDVKETVIQILPKILPKMGAFTGSSRSSTSEMVRDNHGILRSAKEILKLLDTKVNHHDFRLAGSTNTELSHWLQVLDSHEQNLDKYIVIPSIGLVMPIADVSKTDKAYANFLSGKTEHFYNYAEKGAVGIPDVGNNFGETGNKIIAGHSSWWKDDNSVKYKTHFQKIINLGINTEIWVYEKDNSGEYSRYIYKTTESYNTSETDVSILKQTQNSILTLFTCTPIGGDIGRWVVKADFIEKQ